MYIFTIYSTGGISNQREYRICIPYKWKLPLELKKNIFNVDLDGFDLNTPVIFYLKNNSTKPKFLRMSLH